MYFLKILLLLLLTSMVAGYYYHHALIPQSLAYHHFADERTIFHIPNFWLVMSNFPFILVGILGIQQLAKNTSLVFRAPCEKMAYWAFFLGAFAIGFGSSYYHWAPDNQTLVYDRLPMTLAFMGILSAVLNERVSIRCAWLLWPLLLLGLWSVLYWHEVNDLRLYYFVQFFPLICLPLLLIIFPATYTQSKYLWLALIMYALSKWFELKDPQVYQLLFHEVSGHMIKHLFAAGSMYCVLIYLQKRKQA